MNAEKRQDIERKVVRHLIRTTKKHGWDAIAVDNGGDEWEPTHLEREVMDHVFSVDESSIKFHKEVAGKGMTHYVNIVLGNDGWDCISDYSYSEGGEFEKIMLNEVDPYCDKLEAEC